MLEKMEIEEKIQALYDKDDKIAYQSLLNLEEIAEKSNETYAYFDEFLSMLTHEKSFIRVRGFRLIGKNAKWDKKNKINQTINQILPELDDEKPTAVRQCLAALKEIVVNKKEVNPIIKEKLCRLNYLAYKDTMQGLLWKDTEEILNLIKEQEKG